MDIGPGDVVEALEDFQSDRFSTYSITKGTRTIVAGVTVPGVCHSCGGQPVPGLLLADYPLPPHIAWCARHWRKVGGSQEATMRQFEVHLKDAKRVKRVVEALGLDKTG